MQTTRASTRAPYVSDPLATTVTAESQSSAKTHAGPTQSSTKQLIACYRLPPLPCALPRPLPRLALRGLARLNFKTRDQVARINKQKITFWLRMCVYTSYKNWVVEFYCFALTTSLTGNSEQSIFKGYSEQYGNNSCFPNNPPFWGKPPKLTSEYGCTQEYPKLPKTPELFGIIFFFSR